MIVVCGGASVAMTGGNHCGSGCDGGGGNHCGKDCSSTIKQSFVEP